MANRISLALAEYFLENTLEIFVCFEIIYKKGITNKEVVNKLIEKYNELKQLKGNLNSLQIELNKYIEHTKQSNFDNETLEVLDGKPPRAL